MYGSPVSKDLNLPVQPPMTSSGLLRYRSAPSTLLGEFCEDFLTTGPRAGSPDAGTDNVFSRLLADHQIRDKPPAPAPATAHFANEAAMASQQQQQQQQQMMYHSQQQQQQQQQMAAVEPGLYRTVSNGMEAAASAAGTGAGVSNLIRQSSSPAGFLNHLNMDNGYTSMLRAGMGVGFRNGGSAAAANDSPVGGRLKGQLSFSSRQGSLMSQISEMESEELGGSSPEAAGGGKGFIPGYPMGSGWEDTSSLVMTDTMPGMKRARDSSEPGQNGLAHQFSVPKTSSEMVAIEKFLQFQDAVPCKIRAKRGCATHPRSIAERVRRTKISERIRKLQELVPNMDKQTNTSDMLDLAVDYIKDLQKQVKEENRFRVCPSSIRRRTSLRRRQRLSSVSAAYLPPLPHHPGPVDARWRASTTTTTPPRCHKRPIFFACGSRTPPSPQDTGQHRQVLPRAHTQVEDEVSFARLSRCIGPGQHWPQLPPLSLDRVWLTD